MKVSIKTMLDESWSSSLPRPKGFWKYEATIRGVPGSPITNVGVGFESRDKAIEDATEWAKKIKTRAEKREETTELIEIDI